MNDYFYYKFKLKSVPSDLKFEFGEAIPWFGEQGAAIQVKTSNSFQNLSSELEVLETRKMNSGVWNRLKHPNWTEVLNIRTKVLAKKPHVLRMDVNANNTGFKGCHSKIGLVDYVTNNPTASYEFRNKVLSTSNNGVYEANPVIKLQDGRELVKTNNGGKSTFFPDVWDEAKVLDEVRVCNY